MFSLLYVDDEPGLLEIGKLFLERSGEFRVDTITSAPAALTLLNSKKYDAIISDYQMPEIDGIEFLKKIRSSGNTIPFILFTGRGREAVVIQALNEGADFYLQKGGEPVSQFAELAHHVRQSIQQRRAEASIRDHEQREADIINFLPDATFAIDRAGHIIAWNRAIEEMTDVPAAEMLGKGDYEYAIPFYGKRQPILIDLIFESDVVIAKKYAHIIHTKDSLIVDTALPFLNGEPVTLMCMASPLYNRQGEVVGAIESVRDITERKRAEDAIRESEEQYRRIVETANEGILKMDENFDMVYVNRRMAEMLGYLPEEMIGRNIHSLIAPEDIPDNIHLLEERRVGKSDRFERRFVTKDGRIRWMQVSATPLMDPDGTFRGSFAMCSDITARKAAEEELRKAHDVLEDRVNQRTADLYAANLQLQKEIYTRKQTDSAFVESEERFRTLIEKAPEAILLFDMDLDRYVEANAKVEQLFGCSRQQLLDSGPQQFYRPDQSDGRPFRETVPEHRKQVLAGAELVFERCIRNAKGEDRIVEVRLVHLPSSTKKLIRSSYIDITERKRVEAALRESEERYRAMVEQDYRNILENIQDIFYRTDTRGNLILTSPSGARLLGYAGTEEMIGKTATEFYADPAQRDLFLAALKKDRSVSSMEITLRRKDGSPVTVSTSSHCYYDAAGKYAGVEGIFRDITELKEADESLRRANRQLNLLSGITRHDILNKITVILGFLKIAEKNCTDPGQAGYLERMESAITAIRSQIEFTRVYQILGTNAPQWIDLDTVIPRSQVPVTITLDAEVRGVWVFADPMLEKVFSNLLDNSILHGQQVTRIQVSCQKSGRDLVVVWADNGIGIAVDEKERIFERGFGKNTGLGLFLIREILTLTGITIKETGEPGKGARFEIIVPTGAYRFTDA